MAAECIPVTTVEQGGVSRQRRSSLATIALRQKTELEILPVRQKYHQPGSEVPCGDVPQTYGFDGPVAAPTGGPKISVAPAHIARPRRRPSSGFKLWQSATRAVRRRILDAKLKQHGSRSAGQQTRQRGSLPCISPAGRSSDDEDNEDATDHDEWSPAATATSAQKLVQITQIATNEHTRSPRADELLAESGAMITSCGPQMLTGLAQQPHQQLTARSRAGSAPDFHSIAWDTRMKVSPFEATLFSADECLQDVQSRCANAVLRPAACLHFYRTG